MLHRQMQYFVSVVDCGSFTEAAEQNYISQSAISQQIQALEQELGVQLLVRENRKFHLTAAGDYFYRYACKQRFAEQHFYESTLVLHPTCNNTIQAWQSLLYFIKNGIGGCKYTTLHSYPNQ